MSEPPPAAPDHDRKRLELHRDRMAMVGELSSGIAHELNNTVGYISSNLGTLRRYCDALVRLVERAGGHLDPGMRARWEAELAEARWDRIRQDLGALISETRQGADHLKHVVGDLRTLARANPSIEPASLDECVESAFTVLGNLLKHRCAVQRRLAAPHPFPMVRPQMVQLAINLIHNAAISIGSGGGTLRVTTSALPGEAVLTVEDSGPGVPPELRDRIFEPYFTTRANGTGLGLPISRQIAHAHGGEVACDASPELGGARFTATFRGARSSRAETQVNL
jgi:two-component system NtrC family sensor kinase